jgi:DNA-binding GntR family transcriptional regulator
VGNYGYAASMPSPERPVSAARPGAGVRPAAVSSGRRLAPVVYDLLKERLLDGTYQAGEWLPVEELKTELAVSKQPVMDALRRLAADGLVEIIPQVGCRVPVYGPADVADFFAIFGGMESAVAGVAAQRRTERQLAELERVNERIGALAEDPDAAARSHGYRMLNRDFHAVIQDMAHSPVMAEISRRMWDMSDLLINTSGVPLPLANAVRERYADHERVIAALRAGDVGAARTAMDAHVVGTVGIIRPAPEHAAPASGGSRR